MEIKVYRKIQKGTNIILVVSREDTSARINDFVVYEDELYTVIGIERYSSSDGKSRIGLVVKKEEDPIIHHIYTLGFERHPNTGWNWVYQIKIPSRSFTKYLRISYKGNSKMSIGYSDYTSGGKNDVFQGFIDTPEELDQILHLLRIKL